MEYVCLDCGKTFQNQRHYIEKHGLENPPYEEWDGCPYCGGPYIKAIYCDGCENPMVGDYVEIANGDKYCENCYQVKTILD